MEYISLLKNYCREGGKIALELLDSHWKEQKADQSLVTEADRKISDLAYTMLNPIADVSNIITEESLENFEALRGKKEVPPGELLVVIDPIDGTRNYAHQIPIFGISVGILRERRPWIGMVYFPVLDELFYSNGTASYMVREAFRGNPVERLIAPQPDSSGIEINSIVFVNESFLNKYRWDQQVCNMEVLSCAVANLCWPLIGRGNGYVFGAHPWDMAGSWPILRDAGFELRHLTNGKILDSFNFEEWDYDSWKIKTLHIVCREPDFEKIRKGMIPLDDL